MKKTNEEGIQIVVTSEDVKSVSVRKRKKNYAFTVEDTFTEIVACGKKKKKIIGTIFCSCLTIFVFFFFHYYLDVAWKIVHIH